jgi:stalled ribosome alternative rescue factor ArfA
MVKRAFPLIAWLLGTIVISTQIANLVAIFGYDFEHLTLAHKLFGFYGVADATFATAAIVISAWLVTVRPGWMSFALFLASLNAADAFTAGLPISPVASNAINFVATILTHNGLWPALLIFALRFPHDEVHGWRIAAQRIGFATLVAAQGFLTANEVYAYPSHLRGSFWGESVMAYFSAVSLLAAAVILIVRYRESAGRMQMQIRLALVGMITGLCYLIYAMFLIAVRVPAVGYETAFGLWAGLGAVAIAIIPACAAYALVKTSYVDPLFVLNRATVFAATAILLGAAVASIDWLIEHYLTETGTALALQAIATILLALVMNALHRRIESIVERTLFRTRYEAARYLRRLGASLALASNDRIIEQALAIEAPQALGLGSGALFRRNGNGQYNRVAAVAWHDNHASNLEADDQLVRFLRAARSPLLIREARWARGDIPHGSNSPVFAVPLIVREQLSGFALYGAHSDHSKIDPVEEQHLAELVDRACSAFDHVENSALRAMLARSRSS